MRSTVCVTVHDLMNFCSLFTSQVYSVFAVSSVFGKNNAAWQS